MPLSWTPEQKATAQKKGLALFKLQIQLRHCRNTNGNYGGAGPCSSDRGLAMFLLAAVSDDDPRIERVLAILREGEP